MNAMKGRSFTTLALLASTLLATFSGCTRSDPPACTPESAGFDSQPRVLFTELEGRVEKSSCTPRIEVVRSAAELRKAYLAAGAHVQGDPDGGSATDAVALPAIDWAHNIVVVREALDDQEVAWMATRDGALTVGTRGCFGFATGTCRVQFFSVEVVATTATGHACENVACGGAPQNTE